MNAVKKASETKGFIGLEEFRCEVRLVLRMRSAETLVLPYVQPIASRADIPKRVTRAGDMLLIFDIIMKILRPESVQVLEDNVEMQRRKKPG